MPSEQPNSYRPHSPERQADRFFIPTERGEIPVNHLNQDSPEPEEQQTEIAAQVARAKAVAEAARPEAIETSEQLIENIIGDGFEIDQYRRDVLAA